MKPIEILEKYGIDNLRWRLCPETTSKVLSPYLNEDCVIAHLIEKIGFCFIIKTKKTFMSFYGVQSGMYFGAMGYVFRRCGNKKAIKLIKDGGIILNQEQYDKMKDLELLNSLN
jgi:hypothetical protein